MAAKRFFQCGQIVPVLGCAYGDVLVGHDNDIADPVGRQLKPPHRLIAVDHQHDAIGCGKPVADFPGIGTVGKIGGGKGSQRAMMNNIGVGDRQNDTRRRCAKPVIKKVLDIDHGRIAFIVMFRLHAVIRCQDDGRTKVVKLAKIAIDHGMEIQRPLFLRREFVLDVIGGRQIHHIGPPFGQQFHAGGKDEFGQLA